MKRTHPAFWGFGWAGLFVGGLLTLMGLVDGGETAQLAGGYGLLMMAAALYLVGGLGVREVLARRSRAPRASAVSPLSVSSASTNQS